MFHDLSKLVREGKLKSPDYDKRRLEDYQVAFDIAESGSGKKQLFVM